MWRSFRAEGRHSGDAVDFGASAIDVDSREGASVAVNLSRRSTNEYSDDTRLDERASVAVNLSRRSD